VKYVTSGSPPESTAHLLIKLTSTILSFLLILCLYPEVQKKAQAELDQVLNGLLPEFSDRPNLPYVNALIHELNRWHPVLPSGVVSSIL
jgi:cytochrome P450